MNPVKLLCLLQHIGFEVLLEALLAASSGIDDLTS